MNQNSNSIFQSDRRPVQDRSRESLRRIVEAGRALLGDRDFDAVSVPDIAKQAGVSVGSFYARFNSKESLLRSIHAGFVAEARQSSRTLIAAAEAAQSLDEVVRRTVAETAALYRAHRALLRTVFARTRLSPQRDVVGTAREVNAGILAELSGLWRRHLRDRPDPEPAIAFALTAMMATLRELVVFEGAQLVPLPLGGDVVDDVTNLVLGYLAPFRREES